eukprot:1143122-Pelagomonas_calceolata.AAC.2
MRLFPVLLPTDKEQSIRIQSSGGLSEDQIQQMVKDAEAHAENDKRRKEMIEVGRGTQLRNEADTAIYSTEKSLSEYKDKLPQAVVDEINTAIGDCREAAKLIPEVAVGYIMVARNGTRHVEEVLHPGVCRGHKCQKHLKVVIFKLVHKYLLCGASSKYVSCYQDASLVLVGPAGKGRSAW